MTGAARTRLAHQRRERAGVSRGVRRRRRSRSCRRACCRSCPATCRWSPASTSSTLEDDAPVHTRRIVGTTALFIAGFGSVFVLLGLTAASIGQPLRDHQSAAHADLGHDHARDGAVPPRLAVPARAVAVPGEAIPSRPRPLRRRRCRSSRAPRSDSVGRRASARSSVRSSASPRSQQRVWAGGTLLAGVLARARAAVPRDRARARPRRAARSAG